VAPDSTLRSVAVHSSGVLLLISLSAAAQSPLTLGVTAGVPMSDTLRTYQSSGRFGGFQSESATRRYVAGGTVGAPLSSRLSLSLGVQYRRFGYDYDTWAFPLSLQFTHFRGTGASVEVPALLKWSVIHRRSFAPYVALGATYRRLAGMNEAQTLYDNFYLTNPQLVKESSSDQPQLLRNRNALAPSVAGGIEFRARRLLIAPEIRYTRWHSDTLGGFLDPIRWNWQQLDFLLGVAFPLGRR